MSRYVTCFVFICMVALMGACAGPRLRIYDASITSFDRATKVISWHARLENSAAGQGVFCSRTPAKGHIVVQGWVTRSPELDDATQIAAGGTIVVPAGDTLAVGDSKGATFQGTNLQAPSLDGYGYLIIEAWTSRDADGLNSRDASANSSCGRYWTIEVLPLP